MSALAVLLLLNSLGEVVRKGCFVNVDVMRRIHNGRITTAGSFNDVAVCVLNLCANVHMRISRALGVSQVSVNNQTV